MMKALLNKIKNLFKPKITLLEFLSEDYYTYPVTSKQINNTGKKGFYLANGIVFGDAELSKNKKVLLANKDEELRIATLVAGGDHTFGPVFDKHETLITHDIVGVEIKKA